MIYIILEHINTLTSIHYLNTSKDEAMEEFKKLKIINSELSYSLEVREEKTQNQTKLAYRTFEGTYKVVE